MRFIFATLLLLPFNANGAEESPTETTYVQCLENALAGSHTLNLQEIRLLCEEISGTQDPSYKLSPDGEGVIPSNAYTRCYDYRTIEYQALGNIKALEVAKIVCRYDTRVPE